MAAIYQFPVKAQSQGQQVLTLRNRQQSTGDITLDCLVRMYATDKLNGKDVTEHERIIRLQCTKIKFSDEKTEQVVADAKVLAEA